MLLLLHVVLSEREVIHSLICGSALDVAEGVQIFCCQELCATDYMRCRRVSLQKQSRVCVNLPAHSIAPPFQMALWRFSAVEQCLACMRHPQVTAKAHIVQ